MKATEPDIRRALRDQIAAKPRVHTTIGDAILQMEERMGRGSHGARRARAGARAAS